MADITVRNLDDAVRQRLRELAGAHGRSMEAEARAILTAAVTRGDLARTWIERTRHLRGDDLPLPSRTPPRELDLA
jgi:plasmid stability protein